MLLHRNDLPGSSFNLLLGLVGLLPTLLLNIRRRKVPFIMEALPPALAIGKVSPVRVVISNYDPLNDSCCTFRACWSKQTPENDLWRTGCCIMNVPANLSSHGSSLYSHEWQSGGFGEAPSLVQQHVGAWLLGCCLHMFVWSAIWAPVHFT